MWPVKKTLFSKIIEDKYLDFAILQMSAAGQLAWELVETLPITFSDSWYCNFEKVSSFVPNCEYEGGTPFSKMEIDNQVWDFLPVSCFLWSY